METTKKVQEVKQTTVTVEIILTETEANEIRRWLDYVVERLSLQSLMMDALQKQIAEALK